MYVLLAPGPEWPQRGIEVGSKPGGNRASKQEVSYWSVGDGEWNPIADVSTLGASAEPPARLTAI